MRKFKEQRQEQMNLFDQSEEERRNLEKLKQDQRENDSQHFKQTLDTLERRMEEDNRFRT